MLLFIVTVFQVVLIFLTFPAFLGLFLLFSYFSENSHDSSFFAKNFNWSLVSRKIEIAGKSLVYSRASVGLDGPRSSILVDIFLLILNFF